MKPFSFYRLFLVLALIHLAINSNDSLAVLSPWNDLLKAKKITCSVTKQILTRWIGGKPVIEEGIKEEELPENFKQFFYFYDFDHSSETAWEEWHSHKFPVKIVYGGNSKDGKLWLTLIDDAPKGGLAYNVTTVFSEWLVGTKKYMMAKSVHKTSIFGPIIYQQYGTCEVAK